MIIEVKDIVYKGFHIQRVKDKGWKIVLIGEEYLFPHLTAAQAAVDVFLREIVPNYKGKVIKEAKCEKHELAPAQEQRMEELADVLLSCLDEVDEFTFEEE